MNPTTFNDVFARYVEAMSKRGLPPEAKVNTFDRAPLFDYPFPEQPESTMGSATEVLTEKRDLVFDNEGRMRLPFPVIRAFIHDDATASKMKMKCVVFNGWTSHKVPKPCTYILADLGEGKEDQIAFVESSFRYRSDQIGADGKADLEARTYIFDSKHGFVDITRECGEKIRHDVSMRVFTAFLAFCFDVNSPANHIAKVTPDKPGKSPEWRASREYMVILDRRHAANKKGIAEGTKIVQPTTAETLSRISHNRRAHWRHFRSDRFVNAKNTKRWIKDIWVGPLVWRDLYGSTYTILR